MLLQVLRAVADLDRPVEKRPAIPEGVRPEIEVRLGMHMRMRGECVCVYER